MKGITLHCDYSIFAVPPTLKFPQWQPEILLKLYGKATYDCLNQLLEYDLRSALFLAIQAGYKRNGKTDMYQHRG
eukprot:4013968-Amphidinium_carterae.1